MNSMAVALLGDRSGYRGLARSEVYRWFTDPDAARQMYPPEDRDRQSRAQVSSLRVAYGVLGPRSRAGEIVHALERESPEFAEIWQRHEVGRRFEDHKVLLHPQAGPIDLDCQALFTEDQSQCLLVLLVVVALGAATTLALTTAARRDELGLLHRTGTTRRQLTAMTTIESLVTGLTAWGLGTLAVIPAVIGVSAGLLGARVPVVDLPTYAVASVGVVVLAVLAVGVASRRATRFTPAAA